VGRNQSKYKIPPEPKTLKTFGAKPGAKQAASKKRVEQLKKLKPLALKALKTP
jgi:hypothetical protein